MKQHRSIQNALLMPLEGTMDSFSSGVFAQGALVPGTLQSRACPALPLAHTQHLKGSYIFGGYLFHHYGHFLLESLSRLYAIQKCAPLPVLFMTPNQSIAQWQKIILKHLKIKNDLVLIQEPTLVDNLIVSAAGSSAHPDFILDEQIDALGRMPSAKIIPGKKIWLSRSRFMRLYSGGGVTNESEVEELLQNRGWEIIFPEALDISEQVYHLTSAEHVAGFDGSAFLTPLLAQSVGGSYIIFGRRNFVAPTVSYMLSAKGVAFERHTPSVTRWSGDGRTPDSRFVLPHVQDVLHVLISATEQ
jgi:capsular polysaccharide biosynthesis protein